MKKITQIMSPVKFDFIPFYFRLFNNRKRLTEKQKREMFIRDAGVLYDDIKRLGGLHYSAYQTDNPKYEIEHRLRIFVLKHGGE